MRLPYFAGGGVGCGCWLLGIVGVVGAGTDLLGVVCVPSSTDPMRCDRFAAYTESVIDVTMKMIAAQVVALVRTVAAVRAPKAV